MELLATSALRFNKARTTWQARNSKMICVIKIQSIKITYFIKRILHKFLRTTNTLCMFQQFIILVVIIKMYYDLMINNYIWQKMNLKIFEILLNMIYYLI